MAKNTGIAFYNVDEAYVDFLLPHATHLFRNAGKSQSHSRKYIGIVLQVGSFDYFAPLSSFKEKHKRMKNGLDFMKVKNYAVINLNNMFPVPPDCCHKVDFAAEPDRRYRDLLQAEYRAVKPMQDRIRKNAANLYKHKLEKGNSTKLAKRCNDFKALERLCSEWESRQLGK